MYRPEGKSALLRIIFSFLNQNVLCNSGYSKELSQRAAKTNVTNDGYENIYNFKLIFCLFIITYACTVKSMFSEL